MPEKSQKRTNSNSTAVKGTATFKHGDVELEVLKENIFNKHKQMVQEIDEKLDNIFDDFLCEVNKLSLNRFEVEKLFNDEKKETKKSSKLKAIEPPKKQQPKDQSLPTSLPEKHFQIRSSLLTDLFEIKHFSTIYHIFIVIFNLLLMNVFITDFITDGTINIGLRPIKSGFKGFHYGLMVWAAMQTYIILLFPIFKLWAGITKNIFSKRGAMTSLWSFIGVLSVIAYEGVFIYTFTRVTVSLDLGQATSVAVLMELVRFMMKSYAFIRTNVPRAMNQGKYKKVDSSTEDSEDTTAKKADKNALPASGAPQVNDKRPLPEFKHFMYFLFAPTLVYRDEYPRSSRQIKWAFVGKCLVEILSIIFILSFISERFMYPFYNQFGSQFYEIGLKELLGSMFNAMLPGLLCFLCGFYCVLHSWMNAFAELLRFGDRMFYRDWWNSTNFSVYYRTWNVIVHDWLYLYVYKDLYEHIFKKKRFICQLLVFSLSAMFHEYILGFTFRFCYPILFLEFQGAGVFLFFLTRKDLKTFGNCFMWMSLAIGMGLLLSLYHMEYYARKNCEFDQENWLNYFRPISWSCNGIRFSENWEIQINF